MKELTKEQIGHIDNYLDARNLHYIDIRMEVFDHMMSSIEQKLHNDIDFDTALITTIQEWDKELKPMSTWFIGHLYLRPKIVIQKAKKNILLYVLVFLNIFLIPTTSLYEISLSENIKILIVSIAVILIITISTLYFKMLQSNIKTTYLFLFEKCTFYGSLFSFLLIVLNFSSDDTSLFTAFSLLLFCYTLFGVHFFKKHQKTNLLWS